MPSERTVILTRPLGESERLAVLLAADGIPARELPCVEVRPLEDPRPLRDAIRALTVDDLLIITSRAGARAVSAVLLDGAACAAPVAAVGRATADACRRAGLRVIFTPTAANGRALANEVPLPRGVILLARSDRAVPDAVDILAGRGATVGEIVAYRTVPIAPRDAVPDDAIAVFASPSAVDGFALSGARATAAVAIGASTEARVRAVLGTRTRVAGPDDEGIVTAVRALMEELDAINSR